MTYRVMQVTETREEFCVEEFRTEKEAAKWIDENWDNYPESCFYITQPRSFFSDYIYGG